MPLGSGSNYVSRLARELHSQRRLADAEAAYRVALYDHPEDAALYVGLGDCLRAQDRRRDALEAYVTATEFDPNGADAFYGLGECELHPLRRAEAFRETIARAPHHVRAHVGLGGSLLMLGQLAEALHWLRRARQLAPHDLALACRAGELLSESAYHAEAVVFFEQAIAEHPIGDHSAAGLGYLYRGLAAALEHLGQPADAAEASRAASYLLPGPPAGFDDAVGEATDPDIERTDPSVAFGLDHPYGEPTIPDGLPVADATDPAMPTF